jgi:hypothetical protein
MILMKLKKKKYIYIYIYIYINSYHSEDSTRRGKNDRISDDKPAERKGRKL